VRYRDGIPMTSPARTLLDLATVLPEQALRRAARQAQAMRVATFGEILEICDRLEGHRGAGKLRKVVAGEPAPTASPLEDIVLDLLDGAGIPRPLINRPLRCGNRTIVPDFLWPDRRLAIEADSVTWHEHKLVRENDADKQALLEADGYRVIRVTNDQAVRRPKQTLARIRAALDAAG
jgi:REase_MTES_1575